MDNKKTDKKTDKGNKPAPKKADKKAIRPLSKADLEKVTGGTNQRMF